MKTSSAKGKGRRLQKLVAQMISELTGLECGPDCPIESRQMGQNGPDIRLDQSARRLFPFTVECKNTENWSLPSAIKQAQSNLYPGTEWLVFLAKNRTKPIAVLSAEAFFSLLEMTKLHGVGGGTAHAKKAEDQELPVSRGPRV